ncbi:MAG: 50S ribosomal protein L22 [Cytophagales bacterium]|nr:MAG: 50S ribosomal protein L22 [Cytophagales bacterium]
MEEVKKLKKSVRIRMEKEAAREYKEQNQGQLGASKAALNNVPTSPRKMRLVADMIRNQRVDKALHMLSFAPQAGAVHMKKLLLSAVANWKINNENVRFDETKLFVKQVFVDGGRVLKRLRPAPQGRGYRVRKRSNHINIVIDMIAEETKTVDNN